MRDASHLARVADVERRLAKKQISYGGRTRDLAEITTRFDRCGVTIVDSVAAALARGPASVLEIGCGWGRVLLELAVHFTGAPLDLHGMNLEHKPPIDEPAGFAAVAEALRIVPPEQLERLALPTPHFGDATELAFDDESFDVVYSAVTIRFIPDKARVIEHVARVLKPGGRALLHLGEPHWEYDAGPVRDDRLLVSQPCRLVVHRDGELVPVDEYLGARSSDAFTLRLPRGGYCSLVIDKHTSGHLDLGLELDPRATIAMEAFPHPDKPAGTSGVRSAYTVRADVPTPRAGAPARP